ncbi:unnamed protein product [Ixodes pacificus]
MRLVWPLGRRATICISVTVVVTGEKGPHYGIPTGMFVPPRRRCCCDTQTPVCCGVWTNAGVRPGSELDALPGAWKVALLSCTLGLTCSLGTIE